MGPGQNLRVPTTLTGGGDDEELTKVFDTLGREQEKQRRRGIIETKTEWVTHSGNQDRPLLPLLHHTGCRELGYHPLAPMCRHDLSVGTLSLV